MTTATAATATMTEATPADRHLKSIRLPSHASPSLNPSDASQQQPDNDFDLHNETEAKDIPRHDSHQGKPPPASLVSPPFTPPHTPGTQTPNPNREPRSIAVDSSASDRPAPDLLEHLPYVECVVRARIPTTTGQEMWLHLYQNDHDSKEHLAIVFGPRIRSRSLDAEREGETEKDRMIRGAYTGRLHPGRIHSRIEQLRKEAGSTSAQGGSLSSIIDAGRKEVGTAGEQVQEKIDSEKAPLVRIHSECYTGETVWSARCDCGEQLDEAARLMSLPQNADVGGVIIYLRQEGRGIGLGEKLKAYNLQDLGHDTYEANLMLRHPADARSYGLATAMLVDLELGGDCGIRLLTNNPDKVRAIEGPNREVVVKERVAMVPLAWKTGGKQGVKSEEVEKYLSTKIEKFKHMIG